MRRMFSLKQLQEIAKSTIENASEINLSGVLNSPWEYTQDLEIRAAWLNGCTVGNQYAKLLIKNGIAYIVISIEVVNNTDN